MRMATVVLQIITISLVFITAVATCTFLILVRKKPQNFKPRTGQYTALGGGAILWFLGMFDLKIKICNSVYIKNVFNKVNKIPLLYSKYNYLVNILINTS